MARHNRQNRQPNTTPDPFKYKVKTPEASFSKTPPGNLSVNRLVNKRPAWQKLGAQETLANKTLVLADWSFPKWRTYKTNTIICRLAELIGEGFTIYIWLDGELQKITKMISMQDIINFQHTFTYIHPDEVKKLASKKLSLHPDQIQILDDYWIQYLLNDKSTASYRYLNWEEYKDIYPIRRDKTALKSMLEKAKPPIKEITLDHFDKRQLDQIMDFKNEICPDARITTNFSKSKLTTLKLDATDFTDLISTGHIEHELFRIAKFELYSFNSVYLEGAEITCEQLENLISHMPWLTDIKFSLVKLTGQFSSQFIQKRLTNKLIKITLYDVNGNAVNQLLSLSPQLQELNLKQIDFAEVTLEDIELRSLTALSIEKSNIPFEQFAPFISKIESLRTLTLDECPYLQGNADIKLNRLDTVSITKTPLSEAFYSSTSIRPMSLTLDDDSVGLLKFIETMHLTNLSIKLTSATGIIDDTIFSKGIKGFSFLKHVSLQGVNLNESDVNHLMSLPGLKLELAYCPLDIFINTGDSFKYLTQLSISNRNTHDSQMDMDQITLQDIAEFLKKAPDITTLTLNFVSIGGSHFFPELKHLETLTLTWCDITQNDFEQILSAAPNLKKVILNICTPLTIPKERDNIKVKIGNGIRGSAQGPTSVPPMSLNQTYTLDADTTPKKNIEYQCNRIFYPIYADDPIPPVTSYRLKVFNTLTINPNPCNVLNAFTLSNVGSPAFEETNILFVDHDVASIREGETKPLNGTDYYAKLNITLTPEWQSLPSLSARELITHMHLQGIHPSQVQVVYSVRDNLYYIRSAFVCQTKIDFLLFVPTPQPIADVQLQTKIAEYISFSSNPLAVNQPNPTGHDYMNAIRTQQTGACRHRSAGFKVETKENFPAYETRYVDNVPHAMIEIYNEDSYQLTDLGGYPGRTFTQDQNELPGILAKHPEVAPKIRIQEAARLADAAKESTSTPTTLNEAEKAYAKQLATWERQHSTPMDRKSYTHKLTNGEIKKYLIEQQSEEEVYALMLALQDHCQSVSRPVFYVNSPDDLICSSPYIKRVDGNKGIMQQGPGGRLYDFLQQNNDKANPPIIIVNYEQFDADDILRFNSIVDDNRNADGEPIPKSAVVIGLLNVNKPNVYQEQDFYSRFDQVEVCPLSADDLRADLKPLPFIARPLKQKVAKIEVYHGADWKERLLGQWELDGDNLYFKEGELTKALAKGLPIQIQNASWENSEFTHFWKSALLAGKIEYEGITITLPETLEIIPREGYNWNKLGQHIDFIDPFEQSALVLNPLTLPLFLSHYECDNETKSIHTGLPGIIEQNKGKSLTVNLTRELSEDEWARLLTACRKHHVKLDCQYTGHITFPGRDLSNARPKWSNGNLNDLIDYQLSTAVIHSNDVDVTAGSIYLSYPDSEMIEISEVEPADILRYVHSHFNDQTLHFEFQESTRYLLNALASNKTVILRGHFSNELIDALAPLLLQRTNEANPPGKLFIVSEDPASFNFMEQFQDIVTAEDKKIMLKGSYDYDDTLMESLPHETYAEESFFRLQARLNYLLHHPVENSDNAWQGMQEIAYNLDFTHINLDDSENIADLFDQYRLDKMIEILDSNPYIFLTGLTGTGKTTFVEENFNNEEFTLHRGEENLRAWAEDQDPDKWKFLFIDEANIGNRNWSEFEGLYNVPPSILINGELITLTEKHKVIFAGNPLSYGSGRTLPSFFKRHGRSFIFPPLPPEYIYERILKPVLFNTPLESESKSIALEILKAYRFFCEIAKDEVLMSTRETQMIALLILSHHLNNPDTPLEVLTKHYIYHVCAPLVPKEHRAFFTSEFKPEKIFQQYTPTLIEGDFVETESRREVNQELDDLLTLREWQRGLEEGTDAQRYGGLGGIFLQGSAGIGKSELVIAKLLSRGYQEVKRGDGKSREKAFYRMPASMRYEEKKKLLIDAFHEGAIVITDEINSSPILERLLNNLLMGKDAEGNRPDVAGFKLIATKNSDKLSGRQTTSNAIQRRMLMRKLSKYNRSEMKQILCKKGVSSEIATQMINAYVYRVAEAKKNCYKPAPTFRDLLRVAKRYLKALRKQAKQDKREAINEDPSEQNLPLETALQELSLFTAKTQTATSGSSENTTNPNPTTLRFAGKSKNID